VLAAIRIFMLLPPPPPPAPLEVSPAPRHTASAGSLGGEGGVCGKGIDLPHEKELRKPPLGNLFLGAGNGIYQACRYIITPYCNLEHDYTAVHAWYR
jgi:hypothetical protein